MNTENRYDPGTGYYRKEVMEELADSYERDEKCSSVPVGVIYTDINDLKKYHDFHGHLMSDVQIRKVAVLIQEATECRGEYYRLGADEFAVVFRCFEKATFEKYLKRVNELSADMQKTCAVSFAAGVCYVSSQRDIRSALKEAYQRMCTEKERYHAENG